MNCILLSLYLNKAWLDTASMMNQKPGAIIERPKRGYNYLLSQLLVQQISGELPPEK